MIDNAIAERLSAIGREFGHGFDLDLTRIEACLEALGRPQDKLPPVLHVAGTNGKGSTCAYLRAICEAAGLATHVYTSPHLIRPNERVRLAGRLVEDAPMIAAIDRVAATGVTVTYFEAATAAALLLFAEVKADVVVLEVGLGGRLDATNVVDPAVSVITPVDYDHTQYLGETLPQIASEKAGILKPGRPGVIAGQAPEALAVIERRAEAVGAPLLRRGIEWDGWAERGRLVVQTQDRLLDLPPPALVGPHQFENAALAVAAALTLGDRRLDDAAIAAGVAGATWPARMQRVRTGALADAAGGAELWVDGGHNPHAGRAIARTLDWLDRGVTKRTALVCGMLTTKDSSGFLAALRPAASRLIATEITYSKSGTPADALAALASDLGFETRVAEDLAQAVRIAAEGAERVLVCGSLYLAGEALELSGIEL